MAETLALIKRLTLKKNLIEEQIEDLTLDKFTIERRIDDLINNANVTSSENNNNNNNNNNSTERPKRTSRISSGFVNPQPIHGELANFLGIPNGTSMTRMEVTRDINKYIRINGLQDKVNGRIINPDEKLKALLKLDDNTELTYFNLQKHLSPLFKL